MQTYFKVAVTQSSSSTPSLSTMIDVASADHKQQQAHIHELKVLNGTVRDNETKCLRCDVVGHPTWQCLEKDNVTASIICSGVGHIGRYVLL